MVDFLQQNWHWAALAAVSGSWLLFESVRSGAAGGSQLSAVEATLLINREDAIVLDVRDPAEFAQGHIPSARSFPASDLPRRKSELEKWKNRPLILCCGTGARSSSVLSQLKKDGFEKVFNLRGGIMEWEKAGHPLSRKKK